MWTLVWEEGGKFIEDVVPHVWIEGEILRWPPKDLTVPRKENGAKR